MAGIRFGGLSRRSAAISVLVGAVIAPASTRAAAVPPPTPTLSPPASSTVVYGKSVTVHTTMKASGTAVPNTGVQLQKQVPGTTTWGSAGTAHTTSSGVATETITPTRTLLYRWAFLGNTSLSPATSTTAKIQVAQAVTIALSPSSVKRGRKVKIYGTVTPKAKGQKVAVQRKSGSSWNTVGTAKLVVQKLPNGKKTLGYVLSYQPKSKGKQTLRASKAKASSTAAGTSKSVTLKVT